MLNPLRRPKQLQFERTYMVPIERVLDAWTQPDLLRRWWGPDKTTVTDCEIDLRVGGTIHVVTEAGAGMGRYEGTRWPMSGTFTRIDRPDRLTYDARSWTEGEEAGTTIHHTNDIALRTAGAETMVTMEVAITGVGPKAKMASIGMRWGYKAQLDALEELFA